MIQLNPIPAFIAKKVPVRFDTKIFTEISVQMVSALYLYILPF